MPNRIDLTNQKFGKLTVIGFSHSKPSISGGTILYWNCQCDCGKSKTIVGKSLRYGYSKSCGCGIKESCSLRMKGNTFSRKEKGCSGFNALYNAYKGRAKHDGQDFVLTKVEFKELTSSNCHYCGVKPIACFYDVRIKSEDSKENSKYWYNGLDRINSSQGYFLENVNPCCTTCNHSKMDMPIEQFVEYLDRLTTFRKRQSEQEKEEMSIMLEEVDY